MSLPNKSEDDATQSNINGHHAADGAASPRSDPVKKALMVVGGLVALVTSAIFIVGITILLFYPFKYHLNYLPYYTEFILESPVVSPLNLSHVNQSKPPFWNIDLSVKNLFNDSTTISFRDFWVSVSAENGNQHLQTNRSMIQPFRQKPWNTTFLNVKVDSWPHFGEQMEDIAIFCLNLQFEVVYKGVFNYFHDYVDMKWDNFRIRFSCSSTQARFALEEEAASCY